MSESYHGSIHIKHGKSLNNRIYESSNKEELGLKNFEMNHSYKFSEAINRFDKALEIQSERNC